MSDQKPKTEYVPAPMEGLKSYVVASTSVKKGEGGLREVVEGLDAIHVKFLQKREAELLELLKSAGNLIHEEWGPHPDTSGGEWLAKLKEAVGEEVYEAWKKEWWF